MYLDNAAINAARGGDGGSSDFCQLWDITFVSTAMIFWQANTPPSTGGGGPAFNANPGFGSLGASALGDPYTKVTGGQRVDKTFYELGSAMCKGSTGSNVTCLFRCTQAGISAGTVAGCTTHEPAEFGSTTIAGVSFPDGTCTWVSEDYLVGHDYRVGDQVFIQGKCDFYFECVAAGTSTLAASDNNFKYPGFYAGASPSQETFADAGSGTLKWRTKTHSPLSV